MFLGIRITGDIVMIKLRIHISNVIYRALMLVPLILDVVRISESSSLTVPNLAVGVAVVSREKAPTAMVKAGPRKCTYGQKQRRAAGTCAR